MKTFHITNIEWDLEDSFGKVIPAELNLPTEMDVVCESEEEIADTISDEKGWLIKSFVVDKGTQMSTKKVALLVDFMPRTRVVVEIPTDMSVEDYLENSENYDKLVERTRDKMSAYLSDYLNGDNMDWQEDTECPYGSLTLDKFEETN